MNIECNLKIIILLLLFIISFLITVVGLLGYTLNNTFNMYNIKLDYLKKIILTNNSKKVEEEVKEEEVEEEEKEVKEEVETKE